MKKKTFAKPFVIRRSDEGGTIPGGGSAFGGLDSIKPLPFPMSFDEWTSSSFCTDVDGSGGIDFADYAAWWESSGFGADSWLQYNPELAVTEEIPEIPDVMEEVFGEEIGG